MNRFAAMVGIINTCLKTGRSSCELPVNKTCINTLRLFRQQNYIWGFMFTKKYHVKIFFKYAHTNLAMLRSIRVFKKTASNFQIIRTNKLFQILSQHKLYLLSTPQGLTITSIDNLYKSNVRSTNMSGSGKILAEIFI